LFQAFLIVILDARTAVTPVFLLDPSHFHPKAIFLFQSLHWISGSKSQSVNRRIRNNNQETFFSEY